MDEAIFSEVTAKVAFDFLAVVAASVDQQEKLFIDISVKSGVGCVQDDVDGTWVVHGDLDGINQAYSFMSTIYNLSQLDVISNEVRCGASSTPSFSHLNEYTEVVRFAANTPVVPSLVEDDGDDLKPPDEIDGPPSHKAAPPSHEAALSDREEEGFGSAPVEECTVVPPTNEPKIQADHVCKSRRKGGVPRKAIVSPISKKATSFLGTKDSTTGSKTLRPRQRRILKSLEQNGSSAQEVTKPVHSKSAKRQKVLRRTQNIEDVIKKINRSKISAFSNPKVSKIKKLSRYQNQRSQPETSVRQSHTKLTCSQCGKSFSSVSNLNRHHQVSHGGMRYSCSSCEKKFTCYVSLQRHERIVHEGLRCEVCQEIFPSDSVKSLHNCPGMSAGKSVSCNFCGNSFSCTSNLNKHVRSQHSSAGDVLRLNSDEFSSENRASNFQEPQITVTLNGESSHLNVRMDEFLATSGRKIRSKKATLNPNTVQDSKSVRKSKQPIKCKHCDKVFSNSSNVRKHERIVHNNIRFECRQCTRVYTCKEQLTYHVAKVHQGLTYKCEVCLEEFKNRSCLAKHRKLIHHHLAVDSSYQCEECGKTFLYKNNLRRHRKQDHEGLSYDCRVCGLHFKTPQQVKTHDYFTHQGRTFACQHCHKKFASHYKLREHVTSAHTSLRPHKCAVCNEQFGRYSALSYHLQKKHGRRINIAGNLAYLPSGENPKTGPCRASLSVESLVSLTAKTHPFRDHASVNGKTEPQFMSVNSDPFDLMVQHSDEISYMENDASTVDDLARNNCSITKNANYSGTNLSTDSSIGSSNPLVIVDISQLQSITGQLSDAVSARDPLQPRTLSAEQMIFPSAAEVDNSQNPYLTLPDSFSFYDSFPYSPLS